VEWRYFTLDLGTGRLHGMYRCPANGKGLHEQKLDDVEVYRRNGSWHGGQRNRLIDQSLKGWFDEEQDEIPEEQAILLMSKISDGEIYYGFE